MLKIGKPFRRIIMRSAASLHRFDHSDAEVFLSIMGGSKEGHFLFSQLN
jgi:hypothetical protein